MSASNEIATIGTNGGGQVQRPDHSNTLGNASLGYQTERTKKARRYSEIVLSDVAKRNYPTEWLTAEILHRYEVGADRCHAVLVDIAENYSPHTGITRPGIKGVAQRHFEGDERLAWRVINALIDAGLIVCVGKRSRGRATAWALPWYVPPDADLDLQLPNVTNLKTKKHLQEGPQEHLQEGPQEGLQDTADKQNRTEQNPRTLTAVSDETPKQYTVREQVDQVLNELPEHLRPKYKDCDNLIQQCLAKGWRPDQLGKKIMASIVWEKAPGGIVGIIRTLTNTQPPLPPRIKCAYDNCNGNTHENPDTQLPYPCPNRQLPF